MQTNYPDMWLHLFVRQHVLNHTLMPCLFFVITMFFSMNHSVFTPASPVCCYYCCCCCILLFFQNYICLPWFLPYASSVFPCYDLELLKMVLFAFSAGQSTTVLVVLEAPWATPSSPPVMFYTWYIGLQRWIIIMVRL